MAPIAKERKYILIGGILLLLAGAAYRFLPAIESVFAKSDEMQFKEMELEKYRAALRKKTLLQAERVAAERELARVEAGLLTPSTPALAAVDIQNMLNNIAEQKKIVIRSMRVLEPKPVEAEQYLTIPLEVTATASIRQVKELLFRIENAPKLLKVIKLRIRLPNYRRPEEIYTSFTVEGFMKGDKKTLKKDRR